MLNVLSKNGETFNIVLLRKRPLVFRLVLDNIGRTSNHDVTNITIRLHATVLLLMCLGSLNAAQK